MMSIISQASPHFPIAIFARGPHAESHRANSTKPADQTGDKTFNHGSLEIAQREGLQAVIGGVISRAGASYLLSAQIVAATTRAQIVSQAQ